MLRKLLVTYIVDRVIGHCFVSNCNWCLTEKHINDIMDAIKEKHKLDQKPVIVNIKRLWW